MISFLKPGLRVLLIFTLASLLAYAQKPELVLQVGHNGSVGVVGFIHDGKVLITRAAIDPNLPTAFTVKIWEVETGRLLLTIPAVNPIQLSPDRTLLATTNIDDTIKLWDLTTGQLLRTLKPLSSVQSIVFSSDSRSLACLIEGESILAPGSASQIQTWEVASGKSQTYPQLKGDRPEASVSVFTNDGGVKRVAGLVSPDSRIVAHTITQADKNNLVELREVATDKLLHTIRDAGDLDDSDLAFSEDSKILLGQHTDKQKVGISLWDVATGVSLPRIRSEITIVEGLRFSPDARILALSGVSWKPKPLASLDQGIIELFDIASGAVVQTLKGSHRAIPTVVFSPDGKTLASGSEDGIVERWDVITGQALRGFSGYTNRTESVFFSPDGRSLVITSGRTGGDFPPSFILWGLVNGAEPRRFDGEFVTFGAAARTLLFRSEIPKKKSEQEDEKQRQVASYSYFKIKVLDVETGTEIRTLENAFSTSETISISRDGKILASEPCCDHVPGQVMVNLWSVETGKLIRSIKGFSAEIKFITFSPDGAMMAIGVREENAFGLWDVGSGKLLRKVISGKLSAVQFSPNGRQLASISGGIIDSESGDDEIAVKVWSVAGGKLLYTRELSVTSLMSDIAFSPNGQLLAGSSLNIDLWSATTGKKLHTYSVGARSVGADLVASAAFSPDSRLLLSAVSHTDGVRIQLWDIASGTELSFLNNQSEDPQAADFSPDGKTFVTLGRDGLIRLWDLQSGAVIANLAVLDQNDWLAVSPNGRFDGASAAWNRLLWRFPENILNVAPVEIFFNEFYSPGLVADIMSGKGPPATRKIEQLDRRQPQLKLTRTDGPAAESALGPREVTVRIDVTEAPRREPEKTGSGAQDLRLFRNGSLVRVWHGDVLKGQSHVTLVTTLPIVFGENLLTAYAFNHDNIKSADVALTVSGAENLKRQGTAYILAVGINTYGNPQYDLKYAVADAADFAAEIKRQQETLKNYGRVEVIQLYDQEATKTGILQTLAQLAAKAQPEDALIVYFSGHGTAQQQRFYLIPYDLGYQGPRKQLSAPDLKTILAHSISDRELEVAFEKVDAGRLLMVIDACNSGQALDSEEKRRGPMNSGGLAQLAYEKGMYILTAAQSYQAAWEASKLGHGYLTYALIEEGLKQGTADHEPKDQTIVLREWLDYAIQRVPQMQKDKLKEQPKRGEGRGKRELEFVFVEGDENVKDAAQRSVQRPRVFYRREAESLPLIVAHPPAVSPRE